MASGLSAAAASPTFPRLSLSLGSPRGDSPLSPFIEAHEAELLDPVNYEPVTASAALRADKAGRCQRLYAIIEKTQKITSKLLGRYEMEVALRCDRSFVDFPGGVADISKFLQELVILESFSFGDALDEAVANPAVSLSFIQHAADFHKIRISRPLEVALAADKIRASSPLFSSPFSPLTLDVEEELLALGNTPEVIEKFRPIFSAEDNLTCMHAIQLLEVKAKTGALEASEVADLKVLTDIMTIKDQLNKEKSTAANTAFCQLFHHIQALGVEFDTIEIRFKELA